MHNGCQLCQSQDLHTYFYTIRWGTGSDLTPLSKHKPKNVTWSMASKLSKNFFFNLWTLDYVSQKSWFFSAIGQT